MAGRLPEWKPKTLSSWQQFQRDPIDGFAKWLYNLKPRVYHGLKQLPTDIATVVCLSDTHCTTSSVPDGEILLHAGDLSNDGSFPQIQAQLDWLGSLPHKHKIVIGGNHDRLLDPKFIASHPDRICKVPGSSRADLNWHDLIYLHNASTSITTRSGRTLNIFGSPMTPDCGVFAFQYPPIRDVWKEVVPRNTDVLLVHGPPKGYLDMGKGCSHLTREVARIKPKVVVFGHIHAGRGIHVVEHDGVESGFQKVMAGDGGFRTILGIACWLVIAWFRRMATEVTGSWLVRERSSTIMVNAAVDGRSEEGRTALVIQL